MSRDEAYQYTVTLPGQISLLREKLSHNQSQLTGYTTYSTSLVTLKGKINVIKTFLTSADSSLTGGGYTSDFKTEDGKNISDAIDEIDEALENLDSIINFVDNDRIPHYTKEVEKYTTMITSKENLLAEATTIYNNPNGW